MARGRWHVEKELPATTGYLLLFAFLLLVAGCRSVAATNAPPPTATPTATRISAVVRPAVLYHQLEAGQSAPPAAPTSHPTITPAADQELAAATPVACPPRCPSETPSLLQPTFTRPSPEQSDDRDHYWFHRPVPDDSSVWTNKHYPYGSTRGGTLRTHSGVEFDVASGTPVMAANSGTVIVAGDDMTEVYGQHANFYGLLVVIRHDFTLAGQPVYTLYGHLSEIMVTAGEQVTAGQLIARSGGTGVADGPHLHFEVRVGANSYEATRNPLLWLYPFPGRGTVSGMVTWADGQPVDEAPVVLRRIDAPAPYMATTTYASDTVNPDENWGENFAIDDVPAGYYEVSVRAAEETFSTRAWVYPGRTSFAEVVLIP